MNTALSVGIGRSHENHRLIQMVFSAIGVNKPALTDDAPVFILLFP